MPEYIFISGKESFYDDEKILYYCYVGINDAHKSLQYCAYGNTPEQAIAKANSLAFTLNSISNRIEQMVKQN